MLCSQEYFYGAVNAVYARSNRFLVSLRLFQSSAIGVRQKSSLWLCFPVLQKKGVPASERAGEECVLYWVRQSYISPLGCSV